MKFQSGAITDKLKNKYNTIINTRTLSQAHTQAKMHVNMQSFSRPIRMRAKNHTMWRQQQSCHLCFPTKIQQAIKS